MSLTVDQITKMITSLEVAQGYALRDNGQSMDDIIRCVQPVVEQLLTEHTAAIEQKARDDRGAERQAHEIVMGYREKRKPIQIAISGYTLVALYDDGSIWSMDNAANGWSGWQVIPKLDKGKA